VSNRWEVKTPCAHEYKLGTTFSGRI